MREVLNCKVSASAFRAKLNRFLQNVGRIIGSKSLFFTKGSGYPLIGLVAIQIGDVIVQITNEPLVLRLWLNTSKKPAEYALTFIFRLVLAEAKEQEPANNRKERFVEGKEEDSVKGEKEESVKSAEEESVELREKLINSEEKENVKGEERFIKEEEKED